MSVRIVRIVSFGYGHGPAPEADLTVDVRRNLRNPHHDPGMRQLTGLDHAVQQHVVDTPGAHAIIVYTGQLLKELLAELGDSAEVSLAIGCAGGRHRSVVVAEAIGWQMRARAVPVAVEHRDINKPVLASRVHTGGA